MWVIKEWSEESGKGKIEGTLTEPMDFDKSVTDITDFEVGEIVEVELKRIENDWQLVKLWPQQPHFKSSIPNLKNVPSLNWKKYGKVAKMLNKVNRDSVFRTKITKNNDVVIRSYPCCFACGFSKRLVFLQPIFSTVVKNIAVKIIRFSSVQERNYLACKIPSFSRRCVAVTIIDKSNNFYFVVSKSVKVLVQNQ